MKNGIFLIVLISLIGFSGCKARKNAVRTSQVETAISAETRKTDTARVIVETQFNSEETKQIHEATERETLHLDTLGRVRTIVRESVRTQTGSRRNDRGQGSVLSVSGKTDSTGVAEKTRQTGYRSDAVETDSRPVQGVEWLWIIIGTLIAVALILVLRRKFK